MYVHTYKLLYVYSSFNAYAYKICIVYFYTYAHTAYAYSCAFRVPQLQMTMVLWGRSNSVDKQEMDALLNVATSSSDADTASKSPANAAARSSHNCRREEDSKIEKPEQSMYHYSNVNCTTKPI